MRISDNQRLLVVQTCVRALGYEPVIWLFGSRIDDTQHGGDFDLLVELQGKIPLMQELHLQYDLAKILGRKVDLLLSCVDKVDGPWQRLAKSQGVKLNEAA